MMDRKVSIWEKICYAMGDASANIAWRGVAAFLFIVYTDVFGRDGVRPHRQETVNNFGGL